MKRILKIIAIALTFATRTNIHAAVVSGPVVNPANNHLYYLLDQPTWLSSEAEAISLGGHLATINNAAENEFVISTFGTFGNIDRKLAIGFTDADQEGVFIWTSGEAVTYTNWSPGEPNNLGDQDFGFIFAPNETLGRAGQWDDGNFNMSNLSLAVAEVVPEPSTVVFGLATLFTGVCQRRRRNRTG